MERELIGEKISEAKRYAAARGEMVGAVPLGYRRESGQVMIDDEWAPVVRRIFDEYATARYSTQSIAAPLNAEGIRPPTFELAGAQTQSRSSSRTWPIRAAHTVSGVPSAREP